MYRIASVDPHFEPPRLTGIYGDPQRDYVKAWQFAGFCRTQRPDKVFIVIDDGTARLAGYTS